MSFAPSRPQGFTLIELLLVMTILVLVTAGTIASIRGVGGAQKLAIGGNLVVDLAQKARQEAITRSTLAALVLVTGSGHRDWDYRLWTVMELEPPVAPATEGTWVPASKWRMLADGVLVDPTQSGSFLLNPPSLSPALPPMRYGGQTISAGSVALLVFLPTGALYLPGHVAEVPVPPGMRLVLGRWIPMQAEVDKTLALDKDPDSNGYGPSEVPRGRLIYGDAKPGHAGPSNYYQITFNSFTGLPIIDRP
jgi:prepilin-type N-terminal cleavage/methylation domain-containing protein